MCLAYKKINNPEGTSENVIYMLNFHAAKFPAKLPWAAYTAYNESTFRCPAQRIVGIVV